MCKMHAWPPLNQASTNTLQCYVVYTSLQTVKLPRQIQPVILQYCLIFYSFLECQYLLNRSVACAQISIRMVVTKLGDAGCS